MALTRIFSGLRSLTIGDRIPSSSTPRRLIHSFTMPPWATLRKDGPIYSSASQGLLSGRRKLCLNGRMYAHDPSEGLPVISEDELREKFTRGHGPGGQSVNKTTNCCVLTHLPTGITVKVHETRSLDQNRKLARLRLREKLDLHLNKENSQRELKRREASIDRKIKKKKTNERLEKLKAFKEREGLS